MEYRNLGRTGVKVSQLCLGTMMFGRSASEQDSIAIVERALDQGVNFVDTANAYSAGASERYVGKALARGRRASVVLATKVFFPVDSKDPNGRGLSRRHLIDACNASLERLQTDWIDLYQLHRAQSDVPIDETLRALDDLIRAGKVRYIGTSMFPSWKIVESLWAAKELGLNRFVCEQMAYNLLDRTAEREVLPAARTFGIGVIPWAPLCGGLLTGKYKRDDQSAAGRWHGGKDNFDRKVTPAAFDVIEGVVALARDKGCSPSQLALAWLGSQPGVTAPIIGPRTLEQALDNLGSASVAITDEDRARIDAFAPPLAATLRYYDAAMGVDFKPNFARW
ncbi:MAG TPA: aldo/keto reductase [Gammaproteobacteria bacterium]|nr:aldo/keto reductase [Gammaproteobacteria bacterium]